MLAMQSSSAFSRSACSRIVSPVARANRALRRVPMTGTQFNLGLTVFFFTYGACELYVENAHFLPWLALMLQPQTVEHHAPPPRSARVVPDHHLPLGLRLYAHKRDQQLWLVHCHPPRAGLLVRRDLCVSAAETDSHAARRACTPARTSSCRLGIFPTSYKLAWPSSTAPIPPQGMSIICA